MGNTLYSFSEKLVENFTSDQRRDTNLCNELRKVIRKLKKEIVLTEEEGRQTIGLE